MLRRTTHIIALLLIAAACSSETHQTISSPEYEAFRNQPVACGAERPPAAHELQFDAPESLGLVETTTAVIHTSCGDITIQLFPQIAPATVNSFVFLAEQGYFDGTVSHRIAPGFVIQAGDPTATGRGGPGYRLPDELPPSDFAYVTGVVAMANGGAGTGGSQFFIVLSDITLDPDYSVFAAVVGGFETLDAISAIPITTNPNTFEPSLPLHTLYIESITIER